MKGVRRTARPGSVQRVGRGFLPRSLDCSLAAGALAGSADEIDQLDEEFLVMMLPGRTPSNFSCQLTRRNVLSMSANEASTFFLYQRRSGNRTQACPSR